RTSLAVSALRIMRYCLRYNTIPQIQKACAFSTFVGREITCFILGNTAQFPPYGLSTAPAAAARHLRCQNTR
ncbi:MAG: hypothetical protein ACLR51_11205, partial [Subdoligranulum sp.]